MRFFSFRRQLDYKTQMRGGNVAVADRWFVISKTCPACGTHRERRDKLTNLVVSSTVSACGEEALAAVARRRQTGFVKQEVSFDHVCA